MKKTVFEEIVQTMSPEERQNLLNRIAGEVAISETPLNEEEELGGPVDLEKKYKSLNIFHRIFIYLKSLFTGKGILDLMEEFLISQQVEKIEKVNPGIADFRNGNFEPLFYKYISRLQENLVLLQDPLKFALVNNKADFYAFMGNHFLPDVSKRLLEETDPWKIQQGASDKSPKEVKALCESNLEGGLSAISSKDKTDLYYGARTLQILYRITSFPWETLTAPFLLGHEDFVSPCPLADLRSGLEELNDLLYSFTMPPSLDLIEALFLFQGKENLSTGEDRLAEYLRLKISGTEKALETLREFNRKVPVTLLLRYILGNVNYLPQEIPGGEDWFQTYRKFWEGRTKKLTSFFMKEQARAMAIKDAQDFLGLVSLTGIAPYEVNFADTGIRGRYTMSMAFLKHWYSEMMIKELNPLFKKILVDGDFYKKDNRVDFTDSYNNLLQLGTMINDFAALLEPEKDFSTKLQGLVNQELLPQTLKKEVAAIVAPLDLTAETIIKKAIQSQSVMINVLKGIVFGEFGGKYDTLSNISHIHYGGKSNFRQVVDGYVRQLESSLRHLGSLFDIEGAVNPE